ncbi:unnamed protein product [Diatraea saccharalis]|uniref:Uncharacterized protein n=1 Tax=Diatraea saccharalis TaxID=40085 RepID=A0A9N9REB0_9NEOP|nr:unnamed protein product [Diatraea saccharalis]
MDINNPQNQSYWFVLREDQNNVYNFTIHNPSISGQDTRYVIDPHTDDNRQYIQIDETPLILSEDTIQNCDKDTIKTKDEDNFWDRDKIKLLLSLCLDNRFKNCFKDKTMLNEIAILIGSTPEECHKKYISLRKTYIRLLKKKRLGKHIKWVHFNTCEEVFQECNLLPLSTLEPWDDIKVKRLLNLYLENLSKFRDPYCPQKDVWKDIALSLGTTEYNCYNKFKNLKRTYLKWLERNNETNKLIKWPYHNYFEKIYYNYKPVLGAWDKNKTNRLMQAYLQIVHKFKNPKFSKKELWKEISSIVGESPLKCDRKFRNMKQTYIRLKMSRSVTKWCYYKDFEAIYSNMSPHTNENMGFYKEQNYIVQLLKFYDENKEKFRNRMIKNKYLWRTIGSKLGLSSEECHRKFRNLKQTYIRLRGKMESTGKCNKWPYYAYFAKIYDDQKSSQKYCNNNNNTDHSTLLEVKKVLRCIQKSDTDKFEKLVRVAEESNNIQRERNRILLALLARK